MSDHAHDLVDEYDLDPELIAGLLWRYGADIDVPGSDPADLDSAHREVYEFLADEGSLELNLDLSR